MNVEHIKILAWEHWRRCLKSVVPVTGLLALILVGMLTVEYYGRRQYGSEVDGIGVFIISIAAFINGLILLTANSSDQNISFSMGAYYLRLPINPWALAMTRIVLNTITLTLTSLVFIIIALTYFTLPNAIYEFSDPTIFAHTLGAILFIYLSIQMVAWAFSTPTVYIITCILFFLVLRFNDWDYYYSTMGAVIFFITSIVFSGFSLRNARRQESFRILHVFAKGTQALLNIISPKSNTEAQPFSSPQAAQYWLERRSMIQLYKNVFLIFSILFALFFWSGYLSTNFINDELTGKTNMVMLCAVSALITTVAIIGIMNGIMTYKRQTTSIKAFVYTKPISTRTIARTRIKALISILAPPAVAVLVVAIISFLVYSSVYKNHAQVNDFDYGNWQGQFIRDGIGSALLLLWGIWCLTWIAHSISSVTFLYFMVLAFEIIAAHFEYYSYHTQAVVFAVAVGIYSLLMLGFWLYSYKKSILTIPSKMLWGVPIAFVFLYIWMGDIGVYHGDEGIREDIIRFFLISLVLLPFASVPTTIHLTRHR